MTYALMKAAPCPDGYFCKAGVDGTAITQEACGYGKYCIQSTASVPVGALEAVPCVAG